MVYFDFFKFLSEKECNFLVVSLSLDAEVSIKVLLH